MQISERIIEKCGGVKETARLVGNTPSMVYRWTYSKEKGGTGGTVPRAAQEKLLKAAKDGKVDIDPSDFFDIASGDA